MVKVQELVGIGLIALTAFAWSCQYKQTIKAQLESDARSDSVSALIARSHAADKAIDALARAYGITFDSLQRIAWGQQRRADSIKKHYDNVKPQILEVVKKECPESVYNSVVGLMSSCEGRINIANSIIAVREGQFAALKRLYAAESLNSISKSHDLEDLHEKYETERKAKKPSRFGRDVTIAGIFYLLGHALGFPR